MTRFSLIVVFAGAVHVRAGEPVSFARDVYPILKTNCTSCHRPGKLKGGLDLTSHTALQRGGKSGAVIVPGMPAKSALIEMISGEAPEMPKDADPLTADEIALFSAWIAAGAADDTPAGGLPAKRPAGAPVYHQAPAIPALAYSPDGAWLAVAAHHEIVLHTGDGSRIAARLPGESPRIESLTFSADGRRLAAAGGAPSEFGEIQIWNVLTRQLERSIKAGRDTFCGVALSDDGTRVAACGADHLVRAFHTADGAALMECDNHIDWVFGAAFSRDGTKLVSVSRDRAVKLIDVATGHLIDDAARPREPVFAVARHPRDDLAAFTGAEGKVRLHRMAPRGGRLKEGDDKEESAVREFEHMATVLHAVAFSADGSLLACGGDSGEVRVFKTENGQRVASAQTVSPVFALAFHPRQPWLAAAGSDGMVRFLHTADGKPARAFHGVPLTPR